MKLFTNKPCTHCNLIFVCARWGTAKMLRMILNHSTEGINAPCDEQEDTPLQQACQSDHEALEKVKLLVAFGADLNQTSSNDMTALRCVIAVA